MVVLHTAHPSSTPGIAYAVTLKVLPEMIPEHRAKSSNSASLGVVQLISTCEKIFSILLNVDLPCSYGNSMLIFSDTSEGTLFNLILGYHSRMVNVVEGYL